MDYNIVVLSGHIASHPRIDWPGDVERISYLVTVKLETPKRRVDVLPVTLWEPDPDDPLLRTATTGDRVHVVGQLQRRFYSDFNERRSTLEVIASAVVVRKEKPEHDTDT